MAPSSYYAAKTRTPSARAVRDDELIPQLVELWESNYRVYGVRKLWRAARRAGIDICRDQTGRLSALPGSRARRARSESGPAARIPPRDGIRIW